MRKLIGVFFAAFLVLTGSSLGGGYVTGKQTGSCFFTPASTTEGSTVTVYAKDLPTDQSVSLFVLNYETTTHGYGPLSVNPDGTYSGQYVIQADKYTTFQFASPNTTSNTRLWHNVATCKIWADST
jgi:hypothetical protein